MKLPPVWEIGVLRTKSLEGSVTQGVTLATLNLEPTLNAWETVELLLLMATTTTRLSVEE